MDPAEIEKHLQTEVEAEIQNSPFMKVLAEIARIGKEQRTLVIVTHAFIELMVNLLVQAKCKHGKEISNDSRGYSHSIKLTLLNELNIITDEEYKELNWLRKLRNKSAHDWDFTITPEQLNFFDDADSRNPEQFPRVCASMLHRFWRAP